MTETPACASPVISGAGIVGNSLVHQLALLGWQGLVLVAGLIVPCPDRWVEREPAGEAGHPPAQFADSFLVQGRLQCLGDDVLDLRHSALDGKQAEDRLHLRPAR